MMYRYIRLSINNLLHQKRRSWMTVVGIVIGITAVVAVIALGRGLEQAITEEFMAVGADKIQVMGNDLADRDVTTVERVRGVDDAAGLYQANRPVSYRDETSFVVVTGVPTDEAYDIILDIGTLGLSDGRHLRRNDRSGVLVTKTVAETMFERELQIRDRITINEQTFHVAGIVEPTGPQFENWVYMPRDRARTLFDAESDAVTRIGVQVQDGFNPDEVVPRVEDALRTDRGLEEGEEDFSVFAAQDILESFSQVLGLVQVVVLGIASISLLVGGVGIMNTMYTAVTERTREIGIMKAIGATSRQIRMIFLIESGIIGLVGGVIGILLGASLSWAAVQVARQFTTIPLGIAVTPALVGGMLLFSFGVGAVSGVLPARRAAKMDPVDALRYE